MWEITLWGCRDKICAPTSDSQRSLREWHWNFVLLCSGMCLIFGSRIIYFHSSHSKVLRKSRDMMPCPQWSYKRTCVLENEEGIAWAIKYGPGSHPARQGDYPVAKRKDLLCYTVNSVAHHWLILCLSHLCPQGYSLEEGYSSSFRIRLRCFFLISTRDSHSMRSVPLLRVQTMPTFFTPLPFIEAVL